MKATFGTPPHHRFGSKPPNDEGSADSRHRYPAGLVSSGTRLARSSEQRKARTASPRKMAGGPRQNSWLCLFVELVALFVAKGAQRKTVNRYFAGGSLTTFEPPCLFSYVGSLSGVFCILEKRGAQKRTRWTRSFVNCLGGVPTHLLIIYLFCH